MADNKASLNPQQLIQLSKLMSYILRHGAVKENVEMTSDGYVAVNCLLTLPKFKNVTFEQIRHVVDNNDKKRFELTQSSSGEWLIRASQGHSLKTVATKELLTPVLEPFDTPVIHGTNLQAWEKIKIQGLSKMNRNHIHFAIGLPDDANVKSGMRKSSTVFIYIDTEKAKKDNIKFYRSSNNVILSEGIDGTIATQYFLKVATNKGQALDF